MRRDPLPPDDRFGAHVSTAGGVHHAPSRAAEIGTRWTQIFTKAPQQWAEPHLDEHACGAFHAACRQHGLEGTTVHASYLINAASPKEELYERSVASLAAEYRRSVGIGAAHLVVHPGSATDGDRTAGVVRNAAGVARVLRSVPGETVLCLEGTSGKGNVLGARLEELAALVSAVEEQAPEVASRVGVCLDTCHLFAAGYDLRRNYEGVMDEVERTVGLSRVRVWHLNDSEGELGSGVDRHAWIGEGRIGMGGFRALVRDARHHGTPMLLETPKRDDATASDRANLGVLRGLRG